jgi:hypothetical protein
VRFELHAMWLIAGGAAVGLLVFAVGAAP